MCLNYKCGPSWIEVCLVQGSEQWIEFRKDKIGSSDAASILGKGFQTPLQLYNEKQDIQFFKANYAMRQGKKYESVARDYINNELGKNFQPMVAQSTEFSWMIASLDGYEEIDGEVEEIKCPSEKVFLECLEGKIPDYYNIQCQHIMKVLGAEKMPLYVWNIYRDDLPKYKEIIFYRDEKFINNMVMREIEFFDSLFNFTPPKETKGDIDVRGDMAWKEAAEILLESRRQREKAEKIEEEAEKNLIALAVDKSSTGYGVSVSYFFSKGSVVYSKIPELKNVNLDLYRNPGRMQWRIRESSKKEPPAFL